MVVWINGGMADRRETAWREHRLPEGVGKQAWQAPGTPGAVGEVVGRWGQSTKNGLQAVGQVRGRCGWGGHVAYVWR